MSTRNTETTPDSLPIGFAPVDLDRRPSKRIILLGLSFFGLIMALATPQFISLALRLGEISPDTMTADISLMIGVGLLEQIFVLVAVGRLSDFTGSRIGMRRPWFIAGLVGVAIGSVALYYATSVPALWVGFLVLGFGATACSACLYATIADHISERHQGFASGIVGAASVAGSLGGLFIVNLAPGNLFLIFVVPALVAIVPTTIYVIGLPDTKKTNGQSLSLKLFLTAFSINIKASPSLGWFLPSVFLSSAATSVIGSYGYFIIGKQIGLDSPDLPMVVFYANVVSSGISFVISLVVGTISDRIGRRKPLFVIAVVLFALSAAIIAFAPSLTVLIVGYAVAGFAGGALAASYLAVALEAMKDPATAARDIGVTAGVYSLMYAILPLVAPLILGSEGDNFTALLLISAVLTLLSVVFLPKVRVR